MIGRPHMIEAPDNLHTERLFLRQFLESDLDEYARMCANPEVMRYIGDGRTLGRDEAWRSMASALGHWVLRGFGLYACEEKATGRFVGRVGIINPEGWPGMEAGWLIGRDSWNRGFATEAATAVIRMAYESLGTTRLISLIRPENAASIRVAEKLGAVPEKTMTLMGAPALIYAYSAPGPYTTPTILLR